MVALSSKAQYKNYFLSPKLSMVFGSALISLGPFFVEYSDLSAATNSFYRMVIGAICFLLIAFFKGEKKAPSLVWQLCSLTGLLLAIDLIVWNQSVLWIGPGLSTVLANIEIVFLVAIGSIFYGEKLPKNYPLLGLGLAASILSLIYPYLGELHPSNVKGILFALGASFSYSLYLLVLKIIGNKSPETSSVTTLALTCLLGATLFGIGLFFLDRSSLIISSWQGALCIALNSLMSQVLGWYLITKGLNKLNLSISGLLLLTQPGLTFIFDCLFAHRNTAWYQVAGCMLLLWVVYVTLMNDKKGELICE